MLSEVKSVVSRHWGENEAGSSPLILTALYIVPNLQPTVPLLTDNRHPHSSGPPVTLWEIMRLFSQEDNAPKHVYYLGTKPSSSCRNNDGSKERSKVTLIIKAQKDLFREEAIAVSCPVFLGVRLKMNCSSGHAQKNRFYRFICLLLRKPELWAGCRQKHRRWPHFGQTGVNVMLCVKTNMNDYILAPAPQRAQLH